MTTAEIIHGDCLEEMAKLQANTFASGVTDPPYGIRFMGKAWDGKDITAKHAQRLAIEACDPGADRPGPKGRKGRKAGANAGYRSVAAEAGKYDRSSQASQAFQQFSREWAGEMFRILKPGAYLVSFASTRTYHRMVCGIEDAGFEIRDQLAWIFGSGFPKSLNLDGDWEGWGTALKPGWEPIVLARKPFDGTVAANVAKWGTGALNIDACRVAAPSGVARIAHEQTDAIQGYSGGIHGGKADGKHFDGRWPGNLAHDGSAEVLAHFPSDAGAAAPVRGSEPSEVTGDIFGERERVAGPFHGDSGSAARFFYEAKASRADRESGCEDLPHLQRDPVRKEGNPGGDNPRNRGLDPRKNHHPTVKPVDLMRWLCRLVTPPGGRILDPFLGSGTTGVATVLENFDFTGIEREAEYVPIARARIAEAQGPLFRTV